MEKSKPAAPGKSQPSSAFLSKPSNLGGGSTIYFPAGYALLCSPNLTEPCAQPTNLSLDSAAHSRLTAHRAGRNFHLLNDETDGADPMARTFRPI